MFAVIQTAVASRLCESIKAEAVQNNTECDSCDAHKQSEEIRCKAGRSQFCDAVTESKRTKGWNKLCVTLEQNHVFKTLEAVVVSWLYDRSNQTKCWGSVRDSKEQRRSTRKFQYDCNTKPTEHQLGTIQWCGE
jgi:hypothetical protein